MSELYVNDAYSLTNDMRKIVACALASGLTEIELVSLLEDALDDAVADERIQDEY